MLIVLAVVAYAWIDGGYEDKRVIEKDLTAELPAAQANDTGAQA